MDERRRRGPEVVAHRGSSAELPEHTLDAYLRAIEQGADALECDVRLTADDHLVCVHDRRVERTSNGRGSVSALELAELEGLDWASWKLERSGRDDLEVPDRDHGRLLTLQRLLDAVRDCGRPVRIAIETKHPTRHVGQVERRLAQVLEERGLDGRDGEGTPVRVMSFSSMALQRMRAYAPGVPLVQLVENRSRVRILEGRLPRGVKIAGLDVRILQRHPRYLPFLRERGHRIHVWTVDEVADVELCLEHEVDAIITNRPDVVLRVLGREVGGAPPGLAPAAGPATLRAAAGADAGRRGPRR